MLWTSFLIARPSLINTIINYFFIKVRMRIHLTEHRVLGPQRRGHRLIKELTRTDMITEIFRVFLFHNFRWKLVGFLTLTIILIIFRVVLGSHDYAHSEQPRTLNSGCSSGPSIVAVVVG